jgi:solute:Na+ symporter, SSS family
MNSLQNNITQWWDGAVIPIGLGTSLINNAIFLAGKINREENVLTLPDVLAKRYGKVVEVMVSLVSITSFLFLLSGNLVGMGFVSAYTWGVSPTVGIWVSAAIIWGYTVTGGLFSVAYTDVVQGAVGWYVQ